MSKYYVNHLAWQHISPIWRIKLNQLIKELDCGNTSLNSTNHLPSIPQYPVLTNPHFWWTSINFSFSSYLKYDILAWFPVNNYRITRATTTIQSSKLPHIADIQVSLKDVQFISHYQTTLLFNLYVKTTSYFHILT